MEEDEAIAKGWDKIIRERVSAIKAAAAARNLEVDVVWRWKERVNSSVEIKHHGMTLADCYYDRNKAGLATIAEYLHNFTIPGDFKRNIDDLVKEARGLYTDVEPGTYEVSRILMDILREKTPDPRKSLHTLMSITETRFHREILERMIGMDKTCPIKMFKIDKSGSPFKFACTFSLSDEVILKHGFLVIRRVRLPQAIRQKIADGGYRLVSEIVDHPFLAGYQVKSIEIQEYGIGGNDYQNLEIWLKPEECFEYVEM